ncbi:MAG: CehA/McbA family metallohydrolase [Verrucomicrobia bacterium]|nr:CehA/McbA family metallohydrolase [Verrucomicrobiota bacterium]
MKPCLSAILAGAGFLWLSMPGGRGDEQKVLAHLARSQEKYSSAEAWAKRRAELREEFLKGAKLWPLPERPPLKAIIHSRREHGSYSVENVALETMPGFYCTGNLYRPLKRQQSGPAILCPHGHFKPLGRMRDEQQMRCAQFARMGATVFSYSMVGWQDSLQTTHDDPLVLALQTWNSLRAVDFVASLDGVDPQRIGVTGASGGGTQTFFLALVDDRIKVSAPVVIVYPWAAPEGCRCEGGMPVMQAAESNAIELCAAVSPRAQLIISVGQDQTKVFPQAGFPFVRRMYEIAGAQDQVENAHFANEGHDFGPSKRQAVYQFFAKHLSLDLVPEDPSRITLEAPPQLEAVNLQHPLPGHAVRGAEAVAVAFERLRTGAWKSSQRPDRKDGGASQVSPSVSPDRTFVSRNADYSVPDLPEQSKEKYQGRGGTRPYQSMASAPSSHPLDGPLADYSFKPSTPEDEALIFTPPGFGKVGVPAVAGASEAAHLQITVRDARTRQLLLCRVNVVGPDGNYYEPKDGPLKIHSLTGQWPNWPKGWGNRPDKAPIRYFGRFFYCPGEAHVNVPAGAIRVEVWKGFEFRPETRTIQVATGETRAVEIALTHTVSMPEFGYYSGDPHLHIPREKDADEKTILDLLEAEDIHFGTILAYNEPAGPYAGFMDKMASPQGRGLGRRSILSRGSHSIVSGQEYRSSTYGHMNLFLLDDLVLAGQSLNANDWPLYGELARQAREKGGVAFHAHGGYAQAVYADVVQGNIDAVELLQFGVYRGIGLIDWYRMLNCGFRIPMVGASDYPACRKLGDCLTYAYSADRPGLETWLKAAAAGRSFVTTGPLLLLEVDGERPGSRINKAGAGPHRVRAKVRVRSEVAPVTHVQLVANGRVQKELLVPATEGLGRWIEFEHSVDLDRSVWIAARAFSLSRLGTPDAESHTNPVYVYLDGKAPYETASLDALVEQIDKQITAHKARKFQEQARVLDYFERSRDILMKIREARGVSAQGHPSDIARDLPAIGDAGLRSHSDEELRAFLKPVPPKPMEEALQSFETVGGFRMELVAREPLVYDPIAAAFDEDGNLYVCEMRDYPYKPKSGQPPLGTVRLLKDTDGDGKFDEAHVYADQLLWPGGVAPWKGGVFVAAPPDIWYFKDTDGDNRADVRRKVFTGFGTQNQQNMLNNLIFGLDHKIYGASAGNGGTIKPGDRPTAEAFNIDRQDFRFDPGTEQFEPISGSVQFGNTFDDWGNRFLCSESQPLLHEVLPRQYLARNPYLPVPSAIHNLAPAPVPIFRISPIERWRQIRSSRRIAHGARPPTVAGASHHVVDAAAGVTIYRGGAYPLDYYGNAFVGDAQNNLIHRRRLKPDGVTFSSERADEKNEFVRSSDTWFRPVNFVNAPDGTLYVLDMSREILEAIHIPMDVVKHLDLRSGRDHGRIYRLAPPNFRYPSPPQLSRATTAELLAALESPHGWWRDSAHRLIYERQNLAAVEPLRRLVRKGASPQTRVLALWSLQGLHALDDGDVLVGLADGSPRVREQSIRLAESRLARRPALLDKMIALASDPDARVRFQLAFSLGESRDPKAAAALVEIVRSSANDHWMRTAVLSSAKDSADQLLIPLLDDKGIAGASGGKDFLEQLALLVGSRRETNSVARMIERIADLAKDHGPGAIANRLVAALGKGLKQSQGRLDPAMMPGEAGRNFMKELTQDARRDATDATRAEAERLSAISLLGCLSLAESRDALDGLLDLRQPEPVQIAAVRALADYAAAEIGPLLLAKWREYSPNVRQAVVEVMFARDERTLEYLQAVQSDRAGLAQVDVARRQQLLNHRNESVRALAIQLLGRGHRRSRKEIIDVYRPALQLSRDPVRGEGVFRRECMACHKIGGIGYAIGPDLASSPSRDAEALLVHVIDPNQYVQPNYIQYVVDDKEGRTYSGTLVAQTATSLTLRQGEGRTETILRANIAALTSTGQSMMPEGFEKRITQQEMADLIAFLQSARPATASGEPPLHIGTEPGLIEPDP